MSEWLSDNVLLFGGDDGPTAAVAAHLPVEPGMVTVVGLLDRVEDWWWLVDAVAFAVPPGTGVRLAVSHAGRSGPDRPAPAASLASQLAVDVLAPDGPVVLTPTGAAFVAGLPDDPDAAPGRWLRFRPDGTVEPSGPRHPTPDWASGVDRVAGNVGTVRATPVPCGLWVHPLENGPVRSDGLVYAVPADPHEVLMVVGSPDAGAPDPAAVADVADELPASLASRLVLVPHAAGAVQILPVARELARRWRREITLSTGLPVVAADGSRSVMATDNSGEPLWRPLVPRLRVTADGEPRPAVPSGETAALTRAESEPSRPNGRWVAELFWAGLRVRHVDRPGPLPALTDADWDARWLTVVVDGDLAESELRDLVSHLPADARRRMRVHRPAVGHENGSAGTAAMNSNSPRENRQSP